jgi:hypothetical protein
MKYKIKHSSFLQFQMNKFRCQCSLLYNINKFNYYFSSNIHTKNITKSNNNYPNIYLHSFQTFTTKSNSLPTLKSLLRQLYLKIHPDVMYRKYFLLIYIKK